MTFALLGQLAAAWRTTSWAELTGAVLAVGYLLLAIRQSIACWVAAFASSCLYVWVMFEAHLYMESALNAFYAVMALYGYLQWRGGGGRPLPVSRWSLTRNAAGFLAVIGLSLVSSVLLRRFTPAAWPFADSMAAWASVFATFLVARKVYENWHWWFVIDALSLGLYWTRGLYVTMLLFGLYLIMILAGLRAWRRSFGPATHAPHAAQRA